MCSVTCYGTGSVHQALPFGVELAEDLGSTIRYSAALELCGIRTNVVQRKVVELHFVPVGGGD